MEDDRNPSQSDPSETYASPISPVEVKKPEPTSEPKPDISAVKSEGAAGSSARGYHDDPRDPNVKPAVPAKPSLSELVDAHVKEVCELTAELNKASPSGIEAIAVAIKDSAHKLKGAV